MTIAPELEHGYHERLASVAKEYPLLVHYLTVHRTVLGRPMTLSDAPYLVEPLKDFETIDGADLMKSVQTRWTELLLQLAFRAVGELGKNVAYVVPTASIRNGFVQRRVDPLLSTVPLYRSWLPFGRDESEPGRRRAGEAENLSQKHLGPHGAHIMFLGSKVAHDFVEWQADMAIVDELDHCDQENILLLPNRMKESKHQQLFQAGNPTLPGEGIAKAYDEGDRRHWLRRCPGCGDWQALDWFVHFVHREDDGAWIVRDVEGLEAVHRGDKGADIRPLCRRCHAPMSRNGKAAWVAEHHRSHRSRRSYHVSRLDVASERVWKLFLVWLLAQGNPARLRVFFNSNLGLPWQAAGEGIDQELLERVCRAPQLDGAGGDAYAGRTVLCGVDVGAVLHVDIAVLEQAPPSVQERNLIARLALSGAGADDVQQARVRRTVRRSVWVGTLPGWDALEQVLLRYRVRLCAVDAQPELLGVQTFRDRMARKGVAVHPVYFWPNERMGPEEIGLELDEDTAVAKVDRTQTFDAVLEELVSGRAVYPSDALTVPDWGDQMKAPKRVLEKDRYKWTKPGPDHYRLAGVYLRVAQALYQAGGISIA